MTVKAVLKSRLWVPIKAVDQKAVEDEFLVRSFDDRKCDKCEYRPDRFSELCEECPAYLGTMKLWKESADGRRVGLPTGDRAALKRVLRTKVSIDDRRAVVPMKHKLKLTTKLFPYQQGPVSDIVKAGYGILKAPPRSGKTLMAIAAALKLGVRTMILAAQIDWLKQFMIELESRTNLKDLRKWEGKQIVGITNDPKKMAGLDIVLSTYQSFITPAGRKRLKEIANKFGLVIIDEVHGVPAAEYARMVLGLHARYKIGLTATDKRKDHKETVLYKIVGPVKASAHVETMLPRVYLHETGASTTYNYKVWAFAMRYLFKHKKRNIMIVKQAVKDIKAGRHVVIPVGTVAHAALLVKNINKLAGENVAVQFTSGAMNPTKREQLLNDARSGKIKCLVGTRQIVQVGINVPIWDCLYVQAPISNAPKFEQETARIRTVLEGKPQPIIRHFIEDFGPSIGCFRTCLYQTYLAKKFFMDDATKSRAIELVMKRKPVNTANFGIV